MNEDRDLTKEERTLAAVLAEVLDCRRTGGAPRLEKYFGDHPRLEGEIAAGLEVMDLLERAGSPAERAAFDGAVRGPGGEERRGPYQSNCLRRAVDEFMERQPPRVRRLFFLRCFEKRSWADVADLLGESARDLRVAHARALGDLLRWVRRPEEGRPRV